MVDVTQHQIEPAARSGGERSRGRVDRLDLVPGAAEYIAAQRANAAFVVDDQDAAHLAWVSRPRTWRHVREPRARMPVGGHAVHTAQTLASRRAPR
jgi:hypothetical protein